MRHSDATEIIARLKVKTTICAVYIGTNLIIIFSANAIYRSFKHSSMVSVCILQIHDE